MRIHGKIFGIMTHVETAQQLLCEGKRLEAARFLNYALGYGTPEERVAAKQILCNEFSAFEGPNYENERWHLEKLRRRAAHTRLLCRINPFHVPAKEIFSAPGANRCNPPSEHGTKESNGSQDFNNHSQDIASRPNSLINRDLLTCVLLLILAKNYITENLPGTSDQSPKFSF